MQALVNQKVRSLGRFEDAQQVAALAGMLADWSLVLQGRGPQVRPVGVHTFEKSQASSPCP